MLNWKCVLTFELRVNNKEVADVWHKLLQKIEMFWKENFRKERILTSKIKHSYFHNYSKSL